MRPGWGSFPVEDSHSGEYVAFKVPVWQGEFQPSVVIVRIPSTQSPVCWELPENPFADQELNPSR